MTTPSVPWRINLPLGEPTGSGAPVLPTQPLVVPAAPKPVAPIYQSDAGPASQASRFVAQARRFVGQPFAWGGGHAGTMAAPGPVDASGLVQQAARLAGFRLDGTTSTQQKQGLPVSMKQLQPGDLVFHGQPAGHVGIYVGNNQVLAASKPGKPVALKPLTSYWDNARRVFDAQGRFVGAAQAPVPAPKPAPAPKPVTPAPKPPASAIRPHPTVVHVDAGDSLWAIAKRELGDGRRWKEIHELNRHVLPDPDQLKPGTWLALPKIVDPNPQGGGTTPVFGDFE